MSGTLVPMGTGVPAGTHRNLENLGTAGYRVPGKFWKLGTGGYRVPGKFSLMSTPDPEGIKWMTRIFYRSIRNRSLNKT